MFQRGTKFILDINTKPNLVAPGPVSKLINWLLKQPVMLFCECARFHKLQNSTLRAYQFKQQILKYTKNRTSFSTWFQETEKSSPRPLWNEGQRLHTGDSLGFLFARLFLPPRDFDADERPGFWLNCELRILSREQISAGNQKRSRTKESVFLFISKAQINVHQEPQDSRHGWNLDFFNICIWIQQCGFFPVHPGGGYRECAGTNQGPLPNLKKKSRTFPHQPWDLMKTLDHYFLFAIVPVAFLHRQRKNWFPWPVLLQFGPQLSPCIWSTQFGRQLGSTVTVIFKNGKASLKISSKTHCRPVLAFLWSPWSGELFAFSFDRTN